jgi:ankyrin repeat protein
MVAQMIKLGADVNEHDSCGVTPLYLAVGNGQVEMVRFLLEHGARVNIIPAPDVGIGRPSMTPLMVAAQRGHAEIAKLLIEHGADISAEVGVTAMYPNGVTALLLATINGHDDVVEILDWKGTAGEQWWKYMVVAIWVLQSIVIMSLRNRTVDDKMRESPHRQ